MEKDQNIITRDQILADFGFIAQRAMEDGQWHVALKATDTQMRIIEAAETEYYQNKARLLISLTRARQKIKETLEKRKTDRRNKSDK